LFKPGNGLDEKPYKVYAHQSLKSWLGRMLWRSDFEDLIDSPLAQPPWSPENYMHDVWDGSVWNTFEDPSHAGSIYTRVSGNLVFSLFVDWFNPYHSKKKHVSLGTIALVCLNLPPWDRYREENILLYGIIPGPKEPSLEQINHLLQPLVEDFRLFQHGVWFNKTFKAPQGRLIKAVIFPLIADLPALRKTAGHSGHSSKNFCSFCTLPLKEIACINPEEFPRRIDEDHLSNALKWLQARTLVKRDDIFEEHGVRYSILKSLSYWRPVEYCSIDFMHCILLGNLKDFCLTYLDVSKAGKLLKNERDRRIKWCLRTSMDDVFHTINVKDLSPRVNKRSRNQEIHVDTPGNNPDIKSTKRAKRPTILLPKPSTSNDISRKSRKAKQRPPQRQVAHSYGLRASARGDSKLPSSKQPNQECRSNPKSVEASTPPPLPSGPTADSEEEMNVDTISVPHSGHEYAEPPHHSPSIHAATQLPIQESRKNMKSKALSTPTPSPSKHGVPSHHAHTSSLAKKSADPLLVESAEPMNVDSIVVGHDDESTYHATTVRMTASLKSTSSTQTASNYSLRPRGSSSKSSSTTKSLPASTAASTSNFSQSQHPSSQDPQYSSDNSTEKGTPTPRRSVPTKKNRISAKHPPAHPDPDEINKGASAVGPKMMYEELEAIQVAIQKIQLPSTVTRVPKQFGSSGNKSLKASEWLVISCVYFPLVLIPLWTFSSNNPNRQALLQSSASLIGIKNLLSARSISEKEITKFSNLMKYYRQLLAEHWSGEELNPKPNIHISQHFPEDTRRFGPPASTASWAQERLNGILGKISTNNHLRKLLCFGPVCYELAPADLNIC
jgi:hypothetical protein